MCWGDVCLHAQKSSKTLQKEKASIEKKIKENNSLLKQINKEKKSSLSGLKVLSHKITLRKQLISNIQAQLSKLNLQIFKHQKEIEAQKEKIQHLKQEYAQIIAQSYISRSKYDKLMYVLASNDLNQAYKRLKFLQQYSQYRVDQAEKINIQNLALEKELALLENSKQEKLSLLGIENDQNKTLNSERNERKKQIDLLKSKSSSLKKDIQKKKNQLSKLNKAIEKAIAEEAKKRAGKKLSQKELALMDEFEKNTGRLPWPVNNGFISGNFGKQKHEIEKNVTLDNPGIYFTSKNGSSVQSVFNGEVSSIIMIPGSGTTVMVRHGKYISVYSNLTNVKVKKGDSIKTGQTLGSVINSDDGSSKFLFSIWKGQTKLNPKPWLRKGY